VGHLSGLFGGADILLGDAYERHEVLLRGQGTADRGTAGSGNCGSRDSADDRARRSDPGGLGGGEEGAGAALEALDLAEGRVLVLDVDVEARVHRGERREEPGPVVHVVPLAEG